MRWGVMALGAACFLAGCTMLPPVENTPVEPRETSSESRGLLSGLLRAPEQDGDDADTAETPRSDALPLARATLARGDVVVAGPEGYCLDPETTTSRRGRGFAVIASCRILSQGRTGADVPPVIVTVTVGPRGGNETLPTGVDLATAANGVLLDSGERDGLVTVHLASRDPMPFDDSSTRYWRGAFWQNGHLVGLALYAPEGSPFTEARGARMLRDVTATIRELSPKPEANTP